MEKSHLNYITSKTTEISKVVSYMASITIKRHGGADKKVDLSLIDIKTRM